MVAFAGIAQWLVLKSSKLEMGVRFSLPALLLFFIHNLNFCNGVPEGLGRYSGFLGYVV